ncbi:AAA family ATPase [Eggerthellaceae bacterium zg-893]|nr:AAA family ATPase [Eggerthellaceae bacterium zg-893]
MLARKMYERFENWKSASSRKVFLLLGARQTGKTFIVRKFAQEHYKMFIEVNFLEDEENGAFLADAKSSQELVSRLSLVVGHGIEPGTLVFFDEVQHLGHNVVTLSKFLLGDGRFDLVLSGSLLGTALEGITSFPVGYARIERMYPLDFEEFCWALGVPESILETVKESYRSKQPLADALHERLLRIFRQYIVVGGMPEAVQAFLDHHKDLGEPHRINSEIVEQYRYDIIKYSQEKKMQILSIFDSIPSQLAKVNKRFVLNSLKSGMTFEKVENDFDWLVKAGVALQAHLISEPKAPLMRTRNMSKFKLYSLDCGILLSQYPLAASRNIVLGQGDGNFGAIYENVVAETLVGASFPLYYYNNNRKGEVDFLIETHEGFVIPIEVKSGKDYKLHTALNNMLGTCDYNIPFAYVLSEANVSRGEREGKPVYYLPLYMAFCLKEEQGDGLFGLAFDEDDFEWD